MKAEWFDAVLTIYFRFYIISFDRNKEQSPNSLSLNVSPFHTKWTYFIQKSPSQPFIVRKNLNPKSMSDLKQMVRELFEKDQQMNSIEKELKTKRAHYHHLILKNSEKVYSDVEVTAISKAFEELGKLEEQKSIFKDRFTEIKNVLLKLLTPLSGGRWVHETEDPINPRWEFWVEDEELKYARLNGAGY